VSTRLDKKDALHSSSTGSLSGSSLQRCIIDVGVHDRLLVPLEMNVNKGDGSHRTTV